MWGSVACWLAGTTLIPELSIGLLGMDCYRHEGTSSEASCVGCQQPICKDPPSSPATRCASRAWPPRRIAFRAKRPGSARASSLQASLGNHFWHCWHGHDARRRRHSVGGESHPDFASVEGVRTGLMRPLGRGWAWGIRLAQWWTLHGHRSSFLWGHGGSGQARSSGGPLFIRSSAAALGLIIGASIALMTPARRSAWRRHRDRVLRAGP